MPFYSNTDGEKENCARFPVWPVLRSSTSWAAPSLGNYWRAEESESPARRSESRRAEKKIQLLLFDVNRPSQLEIKRRFCSERDITIAG